MPTVHDYRSDKFYPKVVSAFDVLLAKGNVVAPVDVFMQIGKLDRRKYEDWRFGRVPFLERVIGGNLSTCNRILTIIGFHAHDLDMAPSQTVYKKWGKGKKVMLRFTKSGNPKIETSYSKCFLWKKRVSYLEWAQDQCS